MIVHIPVIEILHLVMKLSRSRVFLHVRRVLILSLVALCAIGHAGEWSKGFDPSMPACTVPKWGCYQGPPLSLPDSVSQLGMSEWLLLLPAIDLLSALLLLFKPARTYLVLLALSLPLLFIQMFGSFPVPNTNVLSGSGFWLSLSASMFLFLLNMPLAFVEQMELNPDWNYSKYLPWYMAP